MSDDYLHMDLKDIAECLLDDSGAKGAEKDEPVGARYIQMSVTLAKRMGEHIKLHCLPPAKGPDGKPLLDLRDGRVRAHHMMRIVLEVQNELGHALPPKVRDTMFDKLDVLMRGCYETGVMVVYDKIEQESGSAIRVAPKPQIFTGD